MSKNSFFGTLPDGKKAPEASNSHPSAYRGTVGCELRSKLKCNIVYEFRTFLGIFRSEKQCKKVENPPVENLHFNGPGVY